MRISSKEATQLREASLILIDEITMLSKHGLRCIDKLLRDIVGKEQPFGGKVCVMGGDFRQTLPVVPRASRGQIVDSCIKASSLWSKFTPLILNVNMRSDGHDQHNEWLLKIGTGDVVAPEELPCPDLISIPQDMTESDDIVTAVFGANIHDLPVEESGHTFSH